ncbi:hypothetical protein BCM0074_1100 [Bacillus cereus]|nr:hypothetical protein BCM0074_1100 [Bacillus cereus]
MQYNVLEQLIKSLSALSPEKEREIVAVDLHDIYMRALKGLKKYLKILWTRNTLKKT